MKCCISAAIVESHVVYENLYEFSITMHWFQFLRMQYLVEF